MTAVSVTEMQAGDLLVEIELQELSPKQQTCLVTDHDRVGPCYNLVLECKYEVILNIFRESSTLSNPVKSIRKLQLKTKDGIPVALAMEPTVHKKKTLPNLLTFKGEWMPSRCQSNMLFTPTKWPETRSVLMELEVELKDLPGRPVKLSQEMHCLVSINDICENCVMLSIGNEVHKEDSAALRATRAYEWSKKEYMKLNPQTRKAIQGTVFVLKAAVEVLI
ncbi:hypothetical protein CYMTET_3279 [Cymbomonas tetramitiformis]|uniref:Uncharacterized protein n=1 Tax=Cymbomonas tetramitiformis TaxID=36881 RepID=A0AAE0LL65_9CHLO|nr:hypothetical protein CYMTET_3279 [Cymbomonas tetramitiformis]